MKARYWKELGLELKELLGNMTEATAVNVIVKVEEKIELHPAETNDGRAFYHTEQVVDFCRCKKLSNYVVYDRITNKVICRII